MEYGIACPQDSGEKEEEHEEEDGSRVIGLAHGKPCFFPLLHDNAWVTNRNAPAKSRRDVAHGRYSWQEALRAHYKWSISNNNIP